MLCSKASTLHYTTLLSSTLLYFTFLSSPMLHVVILNSVPLFLYFLTIWTYRAAHANTQGLECHIDRPRPMRSLTASWSPVLGGPWNQSALSPVCPAWAASELPTPKEENRSGKEAKRRYAMTCCVVMWCSTDVMWMRVTKQSWDPYSSRWVSQHAADKEREDRSGEGR